ncbi:MAG: helix-turn-helix domain-containing protein [Oceanipulchritudo sp.]
MIGERLEEARKRKSVTIREAAEATKIRGDYLLSMEDNSFDIDLPQIYIRGFLKNYASFLKLDPARILTDYDAHLLGRSSHPGHGIQARAGNEQESLGRVEINPEEPPESTRKPSADDDPFVVTEAPESEGPEPELHLDLDREAPARERPPTPPSLERTGTYHDQESWNENKALYLKIGVVFAGILLVSIILVVLIQLLSGDRETPEINPELAETSPEQTVTPPAAPEAETATAASEDFIQITASDNVTLIVEQTLDSERLYSGSLNAGETISLEKEGPVSIRFTNGSALVIEKGDQSFRPGQSGVGRTVVE